MRSTSGHFFSAAAGAADAAAAFSPWGGITQFLPVLSTLNRLSQMWLTFNGAAVLKLWQPKQFGMYYVAPCLKFSMLMLASSSEPRCGLVGSAGPPALGTGALPDDAPPLVHSAPIIS